MRDILEAIQTTGLPLSGYAYDSNDPSPPPLLQGAHWISPLDFGASGLRMRIDHPADLSLALARFKKRLPHTPLWIQQAQEGRCFRVLGFQCGREYSSHGIIEEQWTQGNYAVAMRLIAPAALPPEEERLFTLAQQAASACPPRSGPLDILLVSSEAGLSLIDIQACAQRHPAHRALLRHCWGIELEAPDKEKPQGPLAPENTIAYAALGWLFSHSGTLERIEGVAASQALAGIEQVQLAVQRGDQLGHIIDTATRDRIGYVLALAASAPEAEARLKQALELIHIQTCPFLS